MSESFTPTVGLHDGVPIDVYHEQTDWLGSTQLKALLPEHFKTGGSQEALDFGAMFHTVVLEPDSVADQYVAFDEATVGVKKDGSPADSPRATTAWKTAVSEAHAAGLTVVDQTDLERAYAMRDAAYAHDIARALLFGDSGRSEVSAFAVDADAVKHKARFDRLLVGEAVDLKSTASKPGTHSLTQTVLGYGYDVSAAHYLAVAELLGLDIRAPFTLVFVGKEPPHRVTVCDLDELLIAHGQRLRELAIQRARELAEPYEGATGRLTLHCPLWAVPDDEIVVA